MYEEINNIKDEYSLKIEKRHKYNHSLEELDNRLEYYNKIIISKDGSSNGNKYLIDNKSKFKGILGKVSDCISTSDEYMTALSVANGTISVRFIFENGSVQNSNSEFRRSLQQIFGQKDFPLFSMRKCSINSCHFFFQWKIQRKSDVVVSIF